jgi:hypothetical protein
MALAVLLIMTGGFVRLFNRRKFPLFSVVLGGLMGASVLFYCFIPNPYELTHVPEYAILSVLLLLALKEVRSKREEESNALSLYVRSALIAGVCGGMDELYQGALPTRSFTWYDLVLNVMGGIVGLTVYWGLKRG